MLFGSVVNAVKASNFPIFSNLNFETTIDEFRLFSEPSKMSNILMTQHNRVKNITGTRACAPREVSTWKRYWMKETGRDWPKRCRISGCGEPAIGGGHVHVYGYYDNVYIIPMCNSCNNSIKTSWMYVNTRTEAAHVERLDTRGPEGPCYCSTYY